MQSRRLNLQLTLTLVAAIVVLQLVQDSGLNPQTVSAATDLRRISWTTASTKLQNKDDSLELVFERTVYLEKTGARFTVYRWLEKTTGDVVDVALNDSGDSVDESELLEREDQMIAAGRGKFDDSTHQYLMSASPTDVVRLRIKLHEQPEERFAGQGEAGSPEAADPKSTLTDDEVEAIRQRMIDAHIALNEAAIASAVSKLRLLGYEPNVNRFMAEVTIDAQVVDIAKITTWPEVTALAIDTFDSTDDLDMSVATSYSSTVHARGFNGSGQKIAQIENNNKVSHSALPTSRVIPSANYSCGTLGTHATRVAGVSSSSLHFDGGLTYFGHAYQSTLYAGGSCSSSDYEKELDAAYALGTFGATSLGLSWSRNGVTSYDYTSKWVDRYTYGFATLQIASPGNTRGISPCAGDTPTDAVLSPGLAFNPLTVAGYEDNNSLSWSGDLANCGGYTDPGSSYPRVKPELVAPGSSIHTTDSSGGYVVANGTSFAVPAVNGIVSLLYGRQPLLKLYPTAVKAVLMASAYHSFSGEAYPIGAKTGAGGVMASYADDVLAAGTWGAGSYTCGTTNPLTVGQIQVVSGVEYRVALAWMSDPDAGSGQRATSDLDLQLYASGYGSLAYGASNAGGTFEMVSFTPWFSGTIDVRIQRPGYCVASPKQVGWAWWHN